MILTVDIWCWIAILGAALGGFLIGFGTRFAIDYMELEAYRRIAAQAPKRMRELKEALKDEPW